MELQRLDGLLGRLFWACFGAAIVGAVLAFAFQSGRSALIANIGAAIVTVSVALGLAVTAVGTFVRITLMRRLHAERRARRLESFQRQFPSPGLKQSPRVLADENSANLEQPTGRMGRAIAQLRERLERVWE